MGMSFLISTMTSVLWVLLPLLIAVGSALLAVFLMQQRLEVQLAYERQSLREARGAIEAQKATLEELARLREEASNRKAADTLLKDVRTERRQFIRDQKTMFATRKCLVVQERIYFRNIPLCNWVEHEAPIEEGDDIESLARALSVFSAGYQTPEPAAQTSGSNAVSIAGSRAKLVS